MRRAPAQGGYVLVATLGVMLVLSGLIASSSLLAHSALRSARTDAAADRLDALLRGGLEMTAYQLFSLKAPLTAVNGRAIRFGPGTVTPQVADESGRIDVNAASPALIAGALQVAGLDRQAAADIVQKVMAARGAPAAPPGQTPPDQAGSPPGTPNAPAAMPQKPAPAQKPGSADAAQPATEEPLTAPDAVATQTRTGFRTVGEFLAFAGLDRDEAAILSGILTVMNPDGKLNVMTASRRALLALPDISEATVDSLMADRRSALKADLATFKGALDKQKADVKFEGGPCYRVHLVSTDDQHRRAVRDAVIAAGRGSNDPFFILDWE